MQPCYVTTNNPRQVRRDSSPFVIARLKNTKEWTGIKSIGCFLRLAEGREVISRSNQRPQDRARCMKNKKNKRSISEQNSIEETMVLFGGYYHTRMKLLCSQYVRIRIL